MNKAASIFGVYALALSTMILPAAAQDNYPSAPIKMVVTSTPSGTLDIVGRLLAQRLTLQMNVPVVVENRAGDNGNIATEYVAKSKPDGSILVVNSNSIVLSRAMGEKQGYDLLSDLAPISLVTSAPQVLAVHPSVPANTVAEFVAYLRANPNKLGYGTTGTGSIANLGALLFLQAYGLTALHVPYKGGAQIMTDLVGGQIQFTMQGQTAVLPLMKDKRLKGLAVTSLKRSPLIPDLPTVAELGIPGFEVSSWQAVMAPAKTPAAIVKRLNAEILKALQDPDVKSRIAQEGAEAIGSSPEEYAAYLRNDLDRWSKVIKSNGIKAE